MKFFQLFFRWMSVVSCFLFLQGALVAQAPVDTVYTMADTMVARQLLDEVKDLIGKRKLDEAMEKAMMAERIYRQTLGEESREMGDVWHQMGLVRYYKGNPNDGIEYFQKSFEIRLKVLGFKHPDIASSYNGLGNAYNVKGEYDKSIDYNQKALEIYLSTLGEVHYDVARSYVNLAASLHYKGEYDKAIECNQKALNILLKVLDPEHPDIARSYNNLGNFFFGKVEYDISIEYFQKALDIYLKNFGPEHPDVGATYNNFSVVFNSKGEYNKAITFSQKALDVLSKTLGSEHPNLAYPYHGLGVLYNSKGDFDKSVEYHKKALEILSNTLGVDHPNAAYSYNSLGVLLNNKGKYNEAFEYHKKALAIWLKTHGSEHSNVAGSYQNIGLSFNGIGEYDKAVEYHEKALEILYNIFGKEHPDLAYLYGNLGISLSNKNQFDKAEEFYSKALEIQFRFLFSKHPDMARTYNNLGNLYKSKDEYDKAINCYDKAILACLYSNCDYSKVNSFEELIKALNALSRTLQTQYLQSPIPDLLAQSHDYALQAIAAIDYQQSSFSEEATKTFWQGKNYPVYEQAIGVSLLKAGVDKDATLRQDAFTYAEKGKAGQLQAQFQSANAAKVAEVPDSLLQQEHDLRIDIAWREKQRQGLLDKGLSETDTNVLRISGIVFDLKQKATSLVELLREDYPDYHDLKYNLSTITVEEVQRELLRPKEALLEYFVGDSSIFIFVVKKDDYQVVEVEKDFPLEAWVGTLRHNIYQNRSTGAKDYVQAATDLYDKLVRPVEGLLPKRLIIIPDGVLGYVPFDALLTERPTDAGKYATHDYLLKKHQVSYCYSATLLKKMRERQHRHAPDKEFLAFAPFYSSDVRELEYLQPFQFSPDSLYAGLRSWKPTLTDTLRHSAIEAKSLAKMTGGDAFYGSEATEARFDSIAGQYRIVHLATHGVADNRVGDYSFLAFHILPDSTENELLYVRDLYNLELNADMVVLSACETGLGELQRGEGIISLARAFAYAGAKSIVNTLWKVHDQSTSELMVTFYDQLQKGKDKGEALRLAKLAFIKKYPRRALPFFWAGVIPVGDMRRVW